MLAANACKHGSLAKAYGGDCPECRVEALQAELETSMSRPDVDDPRWAWKEYADELQADNKRLREAAQAVVDTKDKERVGTLTAMLVDYAIDNLKAALGGEG
jgi:hypothetical protein